MICTSKQFLEVNNLKVVKVRQVRIGEGAAKICLPLTGTSLSEIDSEIDEISGLDFDLIEWRADYFEDVMAFSEVLCVIQHLRQRLQKTPIIFTFRTHNEGGRADIPESLYFELLQTVIDQGYVDLIDVQLFQNKDQLKQTISAAKKKEIKVILSTHDFSRTPSLPKIIKNLCLMQDRGADICKIAVMPSTPDDVILLMQATRVMSKHHAKVPIVTVSMGHLGKITRVTGNLFGSAITFASGKNSSAPGQLSVTELRHLMDLFCADIE